MLAGWRKLKHHNTKDFGAVTLKNAKLGLMYLCQQFGAHYSDRCHLIEFIAIVNEAFDSGLDFKKNFDATHLRTKTFSVLDRAKFLH